ncbi:uncharacterized protein LOC143027456 [Oratosquilla oratoria]|uniref:uncharacterized protein LOC143027456 n=1 Tax=Oratosquilla oratoria TaxID=337810 RepID=UPI003F77709E
MATSHGAMAQSLWRHTLQPVPPDAAPVSVRQLCCTLHTSPNPPYYYFYYYTMPRPKTAQPFFHTSDEDDTREESVSALPAPQSAEQEQEQPDEENPNPTIFTEGASHDKLTLSMGTKPVRHCPITKIIYTDEQEMELAEWFRENPIFYDKGRRDYKDSVMKAAMYDLKGKSMDPPVAGTQVKSWLDSMRTWFGRITERKSGQGTHKYTERDQWILNTFAFLKGHIVRQTGRQSSQCGVGARIPVTSEEDADVEEVDEMSFRPTSAASTSHGKKKRRRILEEEEDIEDLLRKLQERSRGNEQVMSTVIRQLQPQSRHEAEIQSLMAFVTQQLMGVDPSLIDDVTNAFTQVTRHFRKETRKIQEEREQKGILLS